VRLMRALSDVFQNFAMASVDAIEISDAHRRGRGRVSEALPPFFQRPRDNDWFSWFDRR
jgi:hypothetical protein